MQYLEIYPIENCANKLDKQLDEVLNAKPKMYAKTKQRYKQLAIQLLKSVEKISDILEADSLAHLDSSEFDSEHLEDFTNVSEAVQSASAKINALGQFVSTDSNINKVTFIRYAEIIQSAGQYDFGYESVNSCIQIICKWFQARFLSAKNPKFKYNINQIPTWITNIIILYGKYHSQKLTCKFDNMFDNWIQSVKESTWAVPYEVYQLEKDASPEDFTMDAVLIGDIIMDEYFYQLTDYYSPNISCPLDCYPVASSVKHHNPNLESIIRTRIANKDELIKQYLREEVESIG